VDKIIYTAMNGAQQLMLRQATNSHNLANLNTVGFKETYETFFSQEVEGSGHHTRFYATADRSHVNLAAGTMTTTGRALDIAVNGDGFIAVQTLTGEEAYTRNGQLRVDPNGLLETFSGNKVVGDAGPLAIPPYSDLMIGADGTVSIRPAGIADGPLQPVGRIKLVSIEPDQLTKNEEGLFVSPAVVEPDPAVLVASGVVESSNVNAVNALVTMIDLARQYEMQINLLKAADEKDQLASTMLRIS